MNAKNRLIAVCCLLIWMTSSCVSYEDEVRINKERANKIIDALDRYAQEDRGFPKDLAVLVPEYLDELPKTVSGDNFRYIVWPAGYYELSFSLVSKAHRGCGYMSRYEEWECAGFDIDH